MKRLIILTSLVSVLAMMLISCASEPEQLQPQHVRPRYRAAAAS
jgi:starvation-inducible outer membrane lipoprotein